jgi:hypothetical protein
MRAAARALKRLLSGWRALLGAFIQAGAHARFIIETHQKALECQSA